MEYLTGICSTVGKAGKHRSVKAKSWLRFQITASTMPLTSNAESIETRNGGERLKQGDRESFPRHQLSLGTGQNSARSLRLSLLEVVHLDRTRRFRSAAAQVNIPVTTPLPGRGVQGGQHPYASVTGGGYEYGEESYRNSQQQYGRASPMVPNVGTAPPAVSQVRARGDVGAPYVDDFQGQQGEDAPPKSGLWKILTCRCS